MSTGGHSVHGGSEALMAVRTVLVRAELYEALNESPWTSRGTGGD